MTLIFVSCFDSLPAMIIGTAATEEIAKEAVQDSVSEGGFLLNGLFAALGAGLSFGLLAAAFANFDSPNESCCSLPARSNESLSASCGKKTLDDNLVKRASVLCQPSASEDASSVIKQTVRRVGSGRPRTTSSRVIISEPYCGRIATEWNDRPIPTTHVVVPDYADGECGAVVGKKRVTFMAERKSAPAFNVEKQNPARFRLLASARRSHPVIHAGGVAESDLTLLEEPKRSDVSVQKTMTSVLDVSDDQVKVLKYESAGATWKYQERCSPAKAPPNAFKSSPTIQLSLPSFARENSLTLLSLLAVPDMTELLSVNGVHPQLADVGRQLLAVCEQALLTAPSQLKEDAAAVDASSFAQCLTVDGLGITWDSILHALTRRLRQQCPDLKPKFVCHLFGMKLATVVECKTCDAFELSHEKWHWAFPVTHELSSGSVRYTLLSCLRKKCDPVKVRGDAWKKCRHRGNLYQKVTATSMPEVLVFEKGPGTKLERHDDDAASSFTFPSFPLKLDLSCFNSKLKEARPRYKLHSVTLSHDAACEVYFRFRQCWMSVDHRGVLKKVKFRGTEEKFHADSLVQPASAVHLIYVKESCVDGGNPASLLSSCYRS